jgi:hypothetical protein
MAEEKVIRLIPAEGLGLHMSSAKELLALIDVLIARIEVLEGR